MSILNILNTEILHRGEIPSTQPIPDDNSGGSAHRWTWKICVTANLTLFDLQRKMYSIYSYLNDKTWQFVPFIQWNPPDWVIGPWKTLVECWYRLA